MLSMEQKSVYLIIFNATMISRSLGKTFNKDKVMLKRFKQAVFREIEKLTARMDSHLLTEEDILKSIATLKDGFKISFGQAQKPINVLLKYHYYLNHPENDEIKAILHCPLDSKVLGRLGIRTSLTKINDNEYFRLQNRIEDRMALEPKITFDRLWDERHLRDEGL